jgi:hypothetical protein
MTYYEIVKRTARHGLDESAQNREKFNFITSRSV